MKAKINAWLREHGKLLFDGAMGTWYAARPGRAGARCEMANLTHPEEISAIHRAYLDAGCRCLKTNTFTAGQDLAEGREDQAREILAAGARLALEAAEPYGAFVFGDMGPVPDGTDRGAVYCRQARWFLDHGVRCFLAETLASDEGIPALAAYLRENCPNAFLLVSFAVSFDGTTREGFQGGELLRRVGSLEGVDAVGFNCVSGPQHLLELVRKLGPEAGAGKLLSVMPNAGYPTVLGRRTVFQGTPEYFGEKLAEIARAGASIVGGCCGTTPAHLARAARALAETPQLPPPVRTGPGPEPSGPAHANPLAEKLAGGRRVIAVELDPPADDDVSSFLEGVRTLAEAGADAVTIADCPIGRPRADSSLLACKLKRELGVEPLPHMTCRDRNLNATKALLLGLSMEGVHNVLLVTGDPIPAQDRGEVKSVFNFNSRKLLRYVSGLNETALRTPFQLFAALNVNARNFDMQLKLAREKEDCGAAGFLTQPVLSREALENLKRAREALKGKLLGGIYPVVSWRNACFLNNEIAGMRIGPEILSLYQDKDREAAEELAVRISVGIAGEIAPYTDGLYLMTPFKRVALMRRILEALRGACADARPAGT